MANRTWTGATSTDFNTAGNWAENSVPTTADKVYLINPVSNSQFALGAYDGSAINLAELNVGPEYNGDIGVSETSPLKIGATLVRINGGRHVYLDTGATYNYDLIVYNCATMPQFHSCYVNGVIVDLRAYRGNLSIGAATVTTAFFEQTAGTMLYVSMTTPTITTLNQVDGLTTIDAAATITTTNIMGGSLTADLGTLTTVNLYGGQIISNTNGTITTLNAWGGVADFSQSVRGRTVTTANVHTPATVKFALGSNPVTFTNNIAAYGNPSILNTSGVTVVYN